MPGSNPARGFLALSHRKRRLSAGLLSKSLISLFACLSSLVAPSASADDFFSDFRLNGYISQAVIHTSDNNFFGNSDDSISFDYTEIELLLSAAFWRDFQFSSSLLSRRAGESDDGEIRVDHAFLSYSFFNDIEWSLGTRLGRLKLPVGLYGDTRDVSFTRPGILLPQSIYLERFRDPMFAIDGFELYGQRSWDLANVSWQIALTQNHPDTKYFADVLRYEVDDSDVSTKPSGAARVIYDWDAGRLRLGLTYGMLNYEIDNGDNPIAQALGMTGVETQISTRAVIWSMEYNTKNWKFVGEYLPQWNRMSNTLTGLDFDTQGLSYYLQTTYRFQPAWELIFRRSIYYLDKNDKNGSTFEQRIASKAQDMMTLVTAQPGLLAIPEFAALAQQFNTQSLSGHTTFAKNWVIGVGWHISSSMMARLEYYTIDGTGWIPTADLATAEQVQKDWQMVMMQFSYRF